MTAMHRSVYSQSVLAWVPWKHSQQEPYGPTVKISSDALEAHQMGALYTDNFGVVLGSVASGSLMHVDSQRWLGLRGTYAPVVGRWEG